MLHVHCIGSAPISEAPDAVVNGGNIAVVVFVVVFVLVALLGIETALLLMTAVVESAVLSTIVSATTCLANMTSGIIMGAANPTSSSFSLLLDCCCDGLNLK